MTKLEKVNKIIDDYMKFLPIKHIATDELFKAKELIKQALAIPTKEELIAVLDKQYSTWFRDYVGIEVDDNGVYAIRNAKVEGRSRWSIFMKIDELFENHVDSHLTLEQIKMCADYFCAKELDVDKLSETFKIESENEKVTEYELSNIKKVQLASFSEHINIYFKDGSSIAVWPYWNQDALNRVHEYMEEKL